MNPDKKQISDFIKLGIDTPVMISSSPLAVALKTELVSADPSAGVLTLRFTPDKLFLQGAGYIQGGALTAMADFAMAFAALQMVEENETVTTLNLNAAFMRPAEEASYIANGKIDKCGRKMMFASAVVMPEIAMHRPVLAASSTLLRMGI